MVIVMGFALLGSVFIYQVNLFSAQEKQTQLDKTLIQSAGYITSYAQIYMLHDSIHSQFPETWLDVQAERQLENTELQLMEALAQLAGDNEGHIFVADSAGTLLYVASWDYGCRKQGQSVLPREAMEDVLADGVYQAQNSNFYGMLTGSCYIRGSAVTIETGEIAAVVFAAIPPNNVLYNNLSRVFILITMVVLFVILVVTIVVVRGLLRPLSQMALVARAFVRGDFSARVPLPKRHDELYELTRSFNQMADSIENMEENRRGLIANVSHDLRTPMTTIAGFVDGILDGTIKPDKQEYYLKIISEEVKRLSRLANNMLETSRYEAAGMELNRSGFDLSEMLRRIVIGFQQKIDEKKISVNFDIPDTCGVVADRDAMFQVIYNLVDNAVKFVDNEGQITIYMAVKGGTVQCNIINTGSEIDVERLNKIFDRFYKGDDSRFTSKTGAGLGLYIVKTIVNRHGGDIVARSGNGKTEFCFSIPTS